VTLRDSPFDFTSCSPDEKLEIRGYAMCEFECNNLRTRTAVTVIADRNLAKECLLALRVFRSWPEMNSLFNKISEVIGVEFGRIDSGGGKPSPQINQINTFLGKALARPMMEVDDDLKLLIATPTATKQQQAQCDACDAHGHVQEDCPSFQLDENSLEWRFSKKRLDGHTPNNEIWSLEQEFDLDEPLRKKLLIEQKLNKQLLALGLVTPDTCASNEMQVIDEDEMEDIEGLEDIGHLATRQEIACGGTIS